MLEAIIDLLTDRDDFVEVPEGVMAGFAAVHRADPSVARLTLRASDKLGRLVALCVDDVRCYPVETAFQKQAEPGIAAPELDRRGMEARISGKMVTVTFMADDMDAVAPSDQSLRQISRMFLHAAPGCAGRCEKQHDGQISWSRHGPVSRCAITFSYTLNVASVCASRRNR